VRDKVRAKVGYEWKAIYKSLNKLDPEQTNFVTAQQFEQTCESVGVRNIHKDDINGLLKRYGEDGKINYNVMSKDFGLHTPKFDLFYKHTKREKNIERLKNFFKNDKTENRFAGL